LIRKTPDEEGEHKLEKMAELDRLFNPSTLAVVGASRDSHKTGNRYLSNLLGSSFEGRLYPVNPREAEIMGLKSYPSVTDIPTEVDLAMVTVPAAIVPQVMEDCARKGVKFAVVHSAGFAELGNEGLELQEKMLAAARQGVTRIIGPNCMGLYCPRVGINTIAPAPATKEASGGVAFAGQSGWVVENVMVMGYERGLRFSKVVSIGNQSDLTIEDLLEYFATDDETHVIGFYVEGFKRGKEFLRLARQVSREKPVIVWKAGRTEEGARAAASHTGSIAGSAVVFDAALRQNGVATARNLDELIDLAVGFASPVLPQGNRLGLLVEAGGGAVAAADAATTLGFELPILTAETQQELKAILTDVIPPFASPRNPVDIVWGPPSDRGGFFVRCSRAIVKEVDTLLAINYGVYDDDFAEGMSRLRDEVRKTILVVPGHSSVSREGMSLLTRNGIPTFATPERALGTLAAMLRYSDYRRENG